MKKALGRGLSSLIPDSYISRIGSEAILGAQDQKVAGFELVPISEIRENRDQPRSEFSAEGIEELAQSIREKGVLQPVIVKKISDPAGGHRYELVCGERRLKASLLAGLDKIPAIIKDVAQDDLLEWALIENIQREDLNALEEARAYERLVNERGLSQEEVAKKIGKNRTTVTNSLRLLRLPEEILNLVREGQLSAGHARALLGLFSTDHQLQITKRILKENLSVRQTEEIVGRSAKKRRARRTRQLTPEVADLEVRLSRLLGTQVRLFVRKNSQEGRILIHYFTLDDLDRVLKQIGLPQAI